MKLFVSLLVLASSCVYAQGSLTPLSQDLRSAEAQAFITKSPASRTLDDVNQFLKEEPVAFRSRARQRVLGLIKKESAKVDTAAGQAATNLGPGYYALVKEIERRRIDKQVGSSASSSGGTSLASSGTAPKVLGFAVERGALVQSTQGTVATFRGNLLGLSRMALGAENYPYCAPTSECAKATDALRGLSFSLGFDVSRTQASTTTATTAANTPATAVLTGSKQQLESWGARWDVFNRRDVHDAQFRKKWRESMKTADLLKLKEAFAEATEKLVRFTETPEYAALVNDLAKQLTMPQASTTADCVQIIENYLDKAEALARSGNPQFDKTVADAIAAQGQFTGARNELVQQALTGMSFTAEYLNSRPLNQPTQSTMRFVVAGSPMKNNSVMLTANAALNWYNSKPIDMKVKQFRDFQAAIQLDRKLGSVSENIDAAFSLAGYYQYMADRALIKIPTGTIAPGSGIVLPGQAAALLAPKGHIAIAQAKLTLSLKGSPVKFPIAISWANRTELIKASEVRAHIGATFDFDTLFAKQK